MVPVLLTPDVKSAIITLNNTRKDREVDKENTIVFAVNNGKSKKPMRGTGKIEPFTDIKKYNEISIKSPLFHCKFQCL